jgi:carboxyl-terminal processing protease
VQSIFSISDREALKLTTAKYYTPSGRCIHKSENDERFAEGEDQPDYELEAPDEVPVSLDSLPLYETLSLHRPVRGGGGIMPDIIFEAEEISHTALDLERRAAFFNFAVEWASDHEITLDFDVDERVISKFAEFLSDEEIELEEGQFDENEEYIRMAIRREVLYKEFGNKEAYRSTLEMDEDLQKTLALLKEKTSLATLLALSEEEAKPR